MLEVFKSISFNKNNGKALYIHLYDKIRGMVENGVLLSGSKLPSIRQLSSFLGINQITVVSAFKRLENEGYIYTKPGSGTYVSNIPDKTYNTSMQGNDSLFDEMNRYDDLLLISNGQIKIDENTFNFASAAPTPDLFPVGDFKLVLNEILDRDMGNAFGYQDSQGFYPLRESIGSIVRDRQIHCSPENILVISGSQQGIDIIAKTFLCQGDCVITESPTYTGAIAVFRSRGAEIIDIEMLRDGPDLNILEYNLKKYRPKFIYTIPSFQNPTGYSYSETKRLEMIRLAEKYNTYIIEDDYVSDLDYEGFGRYPLKSNDKQGRVIFIKSFSKIFMPGLRLGFMIAPQALCSKINEAKHTADISTSGLIQRTFDLYIRKGLWDKHFNFMYNIYRERYYSTISILEEYLYRTFEFSKPGGGLNIWISAPYGFSINNLFSRAAGQNIVFAPGRIFFSSDSTQKLNCMRISFAALCREQIEEGLKALCSITDSMIHKQSTDKTMPIF